MKVTKEYLTRIIRESLEEVQDESGQEMPQSPSAQEAHEAMQLVRVFLANAQNSEQAKMNAARLHNFILDILDSQK